MNDRRGRRIRNERRGAREWGGDREREAGSGQKKKKTYNQGNIRDTNLEFNLLRGRGGEREGRGERCPYYRLHRRP